MRRELNAAPFQICGSREIDGWQFIMLDSYDPGHVGGRLTKNELARLDSALKGSPKHAMVCLHHHPIAMGSRWLDTRRTRRRRKSSGASSIRTPMCAPWCGDMCTRCSTAQRGDVRLFATPSTGAQFLPASDRYAVDSRPPAYRGFELHADGRIDCQVHWIESMALRHVVIAPRCRLPSGPAAVQSVALHQRARRQRAARALGNARQAQHRLLAGSIHVLRPSDYPLAPAVLKAYANAKSIFMEVNLEEIESAQVQTEMLASRGPARRQDAARHPGRASAMGAPQPWRRRSASNFRCSINSRPGLRPRPFPSCSCRSWDSSPSPGSKCTSWTGRATTARAWPASRPSTIRSHCSATCPWTPRPSTCCRASSRRRTCPRKWTPWSAPGSGAIRAGSRIS